MFLLTFLIPQSARERILIEEYENFTRARFRAPHGMPISKPRRLRIAPMIVS